MASVYFDGPCGHNDCNLSRAHRHVYKENGVVEYQYMDTRESDLVDKVSSLKMKLLFWRGFGVISFAGFISLAVVYIVGKLMSA